MDYKFPPNQTPSGFSDYTFTELHEHSDKYSHNVREYLDFLIKGNMGVPHCPFTNISLRKRLFFYDVQPEPFSDRSVLDVRYALEKMCDFVQTKQDRFAIAGVIYSHESYYAPKVAERVEEWRQIERLELIRLGLTTAWTHPCNRVGTHTDKEKPNYPLWVSKDPMLMVRYLHKLDEPFMITDEAKIAFVKGMAVVNQLR